MSNSSDSTDLDTSQVKTWRSIVTLIVFVITNIVVLFPFDVPLFVPRPLWNTTWDALSSCRIISARQDHSRHVHDCANLKDGPTGKPSFLVRFAFPMNFVTAPLLADLFLLAILAIGRKEVHDGTLGTNNIFPIDIMAFFLTLAYIAISIDASGLIRYLAFKVLQRAGKNGRLLFFYLYAFFFGLASFIGNDPIILSGTAFLAYLTRVSSNIKHPRAWIHTQFAVANIGSAILVTSNPTNLVLAGAFNITFIHYTANMIVPVVATTIILFPFLLWIIFPSGEEIPPKIELHELPESRQGMPKKNPNIPFVRQNAEREESRLDGDQGNRLSLEEIMNPFVDKLGATFGAVIMAVTLITILALNAASEGSGEHPVYWVTLPGAFIMLCWDVGSGWVGRVNTREIAREARQRAMEAEREAKLAASEPEQQDADSTHDSATAPGHPGVSAIRNRTGDSGFKDLTLGQTVVAGNRDIAPTSTTSAQNSPRGIEQGGIDEKGQRAPPDEPEHGRATFVSLTANTYRWMQETFPTATAVVAHLPFALVPFAFSMFVLVQALVTRGWVPVFAHGWDHWVEKTGTVGAIGGMGFLSVIMCNRRLLDQIFDLTNDIVYDFDVTYWVLWDLAFEPLPTVFLEHCAGDDSLGTGPDDSNGMILLLSGLWLSSADNAAVHAKATELMSKVANVAQDMGLLKRFVYTSYAKWSQQPIES
ncbi:hypothetical protein LTR08_005437 [Meristemomyces frigidus]|nr:hypothetical protein LTR08_005437 [Meristemomyces frigidus]